MPWQVTVIVIALLFILFLVIVLNVEEYKANRNKNQKTNYKPEPERVIHEEFGNYLKSPNKHSENKYNSTDDKATNKNIHITHADTISHTQKGNNPD